MSGSMRLSSEEKYELLEDANDRARGKAFDAARLQLQMAGLMNISNSFLKIWSGLRLPLPNELQKIFCSKPSLTKVDDYMFLRTSIPGK